MTGAELKQYMWMCYKMDINNFPDVSIFKPMPYAVYDNMYLKGMDILIIDVCRLLYEYVSVLRHFFQIHIEIPEVISHVTLEYKGNT